MKIYVDLVLFINFAIDFLILTTTSCILKRYININRILLGAFIGSLTIILLFLPTNQIMLFIIKFFMSIIMVLITFGFHNIKYFLKNFLSFYIVSIFLGGFLYFLNIQFSYKHSGIIFYNSTSINIYFLLLTSPIILYFYYKQLKEQKINFNNKHLVTIYLEKEIIRCTGYLDTGNTLKDPYFHRSVLLINEKLLNNKDDFNILVPYDTIDNHGLIRCKKPNRIEIDGVKYEALIGITKRKFSLNDADCILPSKLEEEIC